MDFCQTLTDLRTERGIYQKELAAYLNVSIGTISNYEQGVHSPDLATLCKLADFFGVTTDFLLQRTKYRYSLDTLNKKLMPDYTVADFINTTLELTPRNLYSMMDYMNLLQLRNNLRSTTQDSPGHNV